MNTETTIWVTVKDAQYRRALDELGRRLSKATWEHWDSEDPLELRCHTQFQTFEDQEAFVDSVKKIVKEMKEADQISGAIDVETEGGPLKTLRCDMAEGCMEPVTHMDEKGFIYCLAHGNQRKSWKRCRKLKPAELRLLKDGKPLPKY